MANFEISINGQQRKIDCDPEMPLLWVLRDELNMLGTKFGCGIAQCGACTVHIDGTAMRSCSVPISSIDEMKVVTIEGLSEKGNHPVQEAWKELDVPQCGYCQAGQIMTASAFLKDNKRPTEEEVENAMHGNICRCAAYNRIKEAVLLASKKM